MASVAEIKSLQAKVLNDMSQSQRNAALGGIQSLVDYLPPRTANGPGEPPPGHPAARSHFDDDCTPSSGATGKNDAWQEPIGFSTETPTTPWPDCLPDGLSQACAAIANHVQAPEALAGFALVGAVAHLAMRLVDARHPKKGAIPASLFLLSGLESGGRKSECYGLATRPIALIEIDQRQRHQRAMKEREKEAAQAKPKDREAIMIDAPSDPRTIFTDTTTQKVEHAFCHDSQPALSLSTDEGGMLLGGHSLKAAETRAASLGSLTRLFDGSGVQRDRIGEGQSGFRFGIRFGLFLSAQPIVLREALSDPLMRGQGFLPRFLYSAPASLAGTRLHDMDTLLARADQDERIIAYWRTIERMAGLPIQTDEFGGLTLLTVGMDSEAIDAWLALYNDTELRQVSGGDLHTIGAFASRAGELAARVAAVFSVWRTVHTGGNMGTTTVSGDDMTRASALVNYSLSEWARHGTATLTPTERDAVTILEWLQRKGLDTVTRTYLANNVPNRALRKDKAARQAAIDELVERGWLRANGQGWTVFKNSNAECASANCANCANSEVDKAQAISTLSTLSTSTQAKTGFSPHPIRSGSVRTELLPVTAPDHTSQHLAHFADSQNGLVTRMDIDTSQTSQTSHTSQGNIDKEAF